MKIINHSNQGSILFISGMFAGSWTWGKCHKKIIGNHYLIEQPLMGISSSIDTIVEQISSQLLALPSSVTVVGNSLGGYVALALAEKVPSKVDQVLLSGSAGFSKIHLDIKDCLSRQKAPLLAQRLGELICYDQSKALAEDKVRLTNDLIAHLRNMLGLFRGCNEVEAAKLFENVHCPVRALWGANDIISPYEDAEPVLRKFGVDTTIIQKCGHSPMYETPNEFADWVNQCVVELDTMRTNIAA